MTGTGSRVSDLASTQQSGSPGCGGNELDIFDTPSFTGLVPDALLTLCAEQRSKKQATQLSKSTVLYRRVSSIHYTQHRTRKGGVSVKSSGGKCMVCKASLIKSSKHPSRSGVVINCGCVGVRVCLVCFRRPASSFEPWYMQQPHLDECPMVKLFFCSACSVFNRVIERICCRWACSECATKMRGDDSCPDCSTALAALRREVRTLWTEPSFPCAGSEEGGPVEEYRVIDEAATDAKSEAITEAYRNALRERVKSMVKSSRHLTAETIPIVFPECPRDPKRCTCFSDKDRSALCPDCSHVNTILELLSENPEPLMASFDERAVPGRSIARNVYDKALLQAMFGDPRLPPCANGNMCKGRLLLRPDGQEHDRPLPSLLSPEVYRSLGPESETVQASSCIMCLVFHQSSTLVANVDSEKQNLEPLPRDPVYYFNIQLAQDVGIPEYKLQDHVIRYQGHVGCYRPEFYYNWYELREVLGVDGSGSVIFLPSSLPSHLT